MKFTKETWRRALRTFMQAALAYFTANLCVVDFSAEGDILTSALVGLLVSTLAAGLAAVMNLEKPPVVEDAEPEEDSETDIPDEDQMEIDFGDEPDEEVVE
jgi:hypothetical protein